MKTRKLLRLLLAIASVAAALGAPTADATQFRAFLSVKGSDANPCTVQAPCRLMPAALNAVDPGGEIWIVDSGNFNTNVVGIGKSVTILAVPGALGSLLSFNGSNALNIYGAGIRVTLRNLIIASVGDASLGTDVGISVFGDGAKLTIESCEIYGLVRGIQLLASDALTTIKDTSFHDNQNGLEAEGPQDVSLDGVRVSSNFFGVSLDDGARVRVSNSVFSNNTSVALYANSHSNALTVLTVSHTTVNGSPSATAIKALATLGTAEVIAVGNTLDGGTAFDFTPAGGTTTIYTSGDNRVVTYSSAIAGSGSLTPLTSY